MKKMNEHYFDEKKEQAIQQLEDAESYLKEAIVLIQSSRYGMSDLVAPKSIHDAIASANYRLLGARVDFEKSRWAAADTKLEFEDWLRGENLEELATTVSTIRAASSKRAAAVLNTALDPIFFASRAQGSK